MKGLLQDHSLLLLTWFIRNKHALLHSRLVSGRTHTDTHRTFVHVQEVTDSVTSAVLVVQTDVPQEFASHRVQAETATLGGEDLKIHIKLGFNDDT